MTRMRERHSYRTTSEHIVLVELTTRSENIGLHGVDGDAADVILVGLERVNSGQCVVVKHADHHVVLVERREVTSVRQ